ncbi:MAG TPA: hypothetical protein VH475_07335 [Tepidisphaeraceae bacterium]|jgi:hypothetical protein
MRNSSAWFLVLGCLLLSTSLRADGPQELPSYVLMQDAFVTLDKSAPDAVFYAYDEKAAAARLGELGVEWPKEFHFPPGSLFVIALSGYTGESFASMSAIRSSKTVIVDLQTDKETKPPKDAAAGKKNGRLLLVGCPPSATSSRGPSRPPTASGTRCRGPS